LWFLKIIHFEEIIEDHGIDSPLYIRPNTIQPSFNDE